MEKGIVKWFSNARGYGFLTSEESSHDIFVHHSKIEMDGFRTLRTGQQVLFEAVSGPKGRQATKIHILTGENGQ